MRKTFTFLVYLKLHAWQILSSQHSFIFNLYRITYYLSCCIYTQYEKSLHTNIFSRYHVNSHLKFKTLLLTNMQIFYGHCSQEDIVFNLRRYFFCLQIFQPWKVDKYAAIHIWNPKNMMHIFLFILNKYHKSWP